VKHRSLSHNELSGTVQKDVNYFLAEDRNGGMFLNSKQLCKLPRDEKIGVRIIIFSAPG
jgi:hypothetical protein